MGCGSRCPFRDQGPCVLIPGSPGWSQRPHARRQRKVASWRAHPGRETKPQRPAAAFSRHWGRSFAPLCPHRPEAGTRRVASRWHGGGLRRKLQAGPHPRNVMDPRVSTGRLGAETSLPCGRNLSTVLRLLLLGIAPFLQPPGPAQSGLRDLGNRRGRDPGKVTGMEEEGGGDRNPSGSAGPFCGLIRTFPRSGHILGAKGTDMAGKRPPTSGTGLGEGARWQAPEQTAPS